ncbi:hypothetical protein ACFLS1_06260 [Verrucomicrobiota bacterium]
MNTSLHGNTSKTTVDFTKMIRGPFRQCPKCGKDTYGVLSVYSDNYRRRCNRAECWHTSDAIPLPSLQKKIIYLDQPAISEIAKVREPALKKNTDRQSNSCWIEIERRLTKLISCQAVVCPESECHFYESLVHESTYDGFKSCYEGVAGGVKFLPPKEIKTRQICRALRKWLGDKTVNEMKVADSTSGNIHAWQDGMRITSNIDWSAMRNGLQKARNSVDEKLQKVFSQWQGDQNLKFDDWIKEETLGVGKCLINSFRDALSEFNENPGDPNAVLRYTHHSMHRIMRDIQDNGISSQKVMETLCEFFRTTEFAELPSVKISAMMFAAIARQAAQQGRTTSPDRGFSMDVRAISSFLPYCDAMFVDKGCWTILTQNPVKDMLGFSTRVFSTANSNDFTNYLDEVSASMNAEHRKALVDVYGEICTK